MVSIGMLTYNQVHYVRQALDGIIMQKVNFRYEVIVGDDASTDGTQDVLLEYRDRYPNIFKLILRSENIGATRNNYDLKYRTTGKYYACLEGDDYWTDENKLQRQVDFLESHPEYVACVHKCRFVDENGHAVPSQPINGYYSNKEVFTIGDFERGELPGQTATLMYRNIFLDREKDYSILYKANSAIGDKTIILLLTSMGNIYNMDCVMSCYRFIRNVDGSNVSSGFNSRNHRDELMEYLIALEQYAKTELNTPLDMSKKKKDYFVAAVTVWLKNPSRANKQIVDHMYELGGKSWSYLLLEYRVILTKLFGWKILKKDIHIRV